MVTVLGSLNMDLLIDTERLPAPGETVRGERFRRAAGGKGANQACAVARMGVACAMIGAVGEDSFGDELRNGLRGDGVDVSAVRRVRGVSTGTAMIVVDAAGRNQIVVAAGANGEVTPEDVRRNAELIRRSKALVVQLEVPLAAVESALREARRSSVLTVLNPAPIAPLSNEMLQLCDWIIPNEIEAGQIIGGTIRTLPEATAAAREIRNRSQVTNVAVTLGRDGVWIESDAFSGHVPAFTVDAVDTVAAGDTFIGAFVARLVEGTPVVDSARFACAAAAISVTHAGAQASIPTRAEVEAWLRGR